MIKANELVWKLEKEHLYETTVEFERSALYHDLYFEVYAICYPMWIARLCSKGYRIWQDETTSNAKAKAACQAHFQQMVENMVDMEHLKNIIKAAIAQGLACQPLLYPDFIKNLEQKGSQ